MLDWSSALPTFVITLREGVEAALVVGIVLSLLKKTQRQDLSAWVWGAVFAGVLASFATGGLFQFLLAWVQRTEGFWADVIEPLIKVGFTGMAIALLSWMLLWMTEQAKSMKANVESEIQSMMSQDDNAGWGVFGLVFIAVLREGFETAIFLMTQDSSGGIALLGAIAGAIGAVVIGWMLFSLGVRLNLKRFFQIMGAFLILIVSGLVMSLGKSLDVLAMMLEQTSQWNGHLCLFMNDPQTSCLWGPLVWNGESVMPEKQFPGLLFKSLLGYRDHIFLGQGLAYLGFLVGLTQQYWRRLNGQPQPESATGTPVKPKISES